VTNGAKRLGAAEAIISPEKLRDYILSPAHPDGRSKATYLALAGYSREDWSRLERDLRNQHLLLEARPGGITPWGRKYEILGPLIGPNGRTLWIRTFWIVRNDESAARLITLIPAREP
jgi:hypothetical protein